MVIYENSIYQYVEDFHFDILKEIPNSVKFVRFEYFEAEKETKIGKIFFLDQNKKKIEGLFILRSELEIRKIEEAYLRYFTHS